MSCSLTRSLTRAYRPPVRQVYALSKERDALKRGTEKLADYGALLKEKDGIIRQVGLTKAR